MRSREDAATKRKLVRPSARDFVTAFQKSNWTPNLASRAPSASLNSYQAEYANGASACAGPRHGHSYWQNVAWGEPPSTGVTAVAGAPPVPGMSGTSQLLYFVWPKEMPPCSSPPLPKRQF